LLSAAEVARGIVNLPTEDSAPAPLQSLEKQGMQLGTIDARANLQEAMVVLRKAELGALAVVTGLRKSMIDGVITRQAIDKQYR
jgi:predicted transcriptional regulator